MMVFLAFALPDVVLITVSLSADDTVLPDIAMKQITTEKCIKHKLVQIVCKQDKIKILNCIFPLY